MVSSDPILTFHVPDNGLEFGDELQGELTRRAGEDVGFMRYIKTMWTTTTIPIMT